MKTLLPLLVVLTIAVSPAVPAEETPAPPRAPLTPAALLESQAPAVVTVKCVLKVEISMMGQSQETERNKEARGVLVSPSGLVMTASSSFDAGGAAGGAIGRMLGGQLQMKAVPSAVKVLFGNEVEEHEAVLVARDSNLDIAFVQVLDLGEKKVPFVALVPGDAKPAVGMDLYAVTRTGRAFDCAPMVGRLFVTASLEKPRRMWSVAGEVAAMGHPVFDAFGRAMGVLSLQQGSEGVDAGEDSSGLGALFAADDIQDGMQLVVLPLEDVARAQQAAEKRAEEAIAEHRKALAEPAGEPGEGEEPAGGGKPADGETPKPPEEPEDPARPE